MENSQEKINDIRFPDSSGKPALIDLGAFFDRAIIKVIRLNQSNLFTDLYLEIKERIINLSHKQHLRIKTFCSEEFKDVTKKGISRSSIVGIIKKNRRILVDPVSIIDPLGKQERNTIDIREGKIIPSQKTYPDFYRLPLRTKQKVKKFYRSEKQKIRGFYQEHAAAMKKGIIRGMKLTILVVVICATVGLSLMGYANYMKSEVTKAYQIVYSLKTAKSPEELKDLSWSARSKFRTLKLFLAPANLFANNFLYRNRSVKMADDVISGGSEISNVAMITASIWRDLLDGFAELKPDRSSEDTLSYTILKDFKATDFFKKELENITSLDASLKKAVSCYRDVKDLGNPSINTKFKQAKEALEETQKNLSLILDNKDTLLYTLGDTKPMTYMILNQNKDELRANGGFPGSAVTLQLYKGSILSYDKRDIYYYDWHLNPYREAAPEGLNIISSNFGLRDSNYYPVFLDSANKINFFYEKAGGGSLDTIIGINQSFVEDLIDKYGPIQLDGIKSPITKKNFSLLMSTLVENKYMKVVSPKDILFRFSDKLEGKLFEKKDFAGYMEIFMKNLYGNEIVIASRDARIQKYLDSLGFSEQWMKDKGNWLYPVFTSISGNKSDRYMKRDFTIKSTPVGKCEVLNQFSLTTKNTFDDAAKAVIVEVLDDLKITDPDERSRLIGIEGNGENRQFIRMLVPKGSRIANPYDSNVIADDSHPKYTFFKFYQRADISKTSVVRFDYISKPANCQEKAIFYKQPGLVDHSFKMLK